MIDLRLSRRRFGGLALGIAAAVALPGCGALRGQTGELLTTRAPLPARFAVALPVPPVLQPVRRTADTDLYEITQRVGRLEILPGLTTTVLGYNGRFPGPTIVSRSGRMTKVVHTNELAVPTVVHLHGGHTPADSDGYPTDLVLPVDAVHPTEADHEHGGDIAYGSREHTYPMQQRAATLWYHDHRMDFTGPAVYRGLAGFHLVHDDEEASLPLPADERDIPLMITDRAFEEDGAFRYPAIDPSMTITPGVEDEHMEGVLGDVVLVNGAPWPELEVDAVRYRFRLLNASNARRYDLALDPPPPSGPSFVQIGSDGGLLAAPIEHSHLVIAAAERFDVVIDFSAYPVGTAVTLRNRLGEGSTASVMRFRVARSASDGSAIPAVLSEVEPLSPSAAVVRREFRFTRGAVGDVAGWTINGLEFDPRRADASPALGQVERWSFVTDVHHPVHAHLDPFQVVRRGGGSPGPSDAGWKDTVDVRPGEVVEVLVRFTDYAGWFVMHCHNLEHEDMMMMANVDTH